MRESEGSEGAVVLNSPPITTPFPWKELVVSWNVDLPAGAGLKVEAQAKFPGRTSSAFYTMGWWAEDASRHKRESVTGQQDEDGDVKTDTLVLQREASGARVRLTLLPGEGGQLPKRAVSRRAATTAARGRLLDVPEKSQLAYEVSRHWCRGARLT